MQDTISNIFSAIPDSRVEGRCLHKLSDILFISFCTMLSNGEDFEDMVEFGKQRQDWLEEILELPNGIPSHDTFNRVFQLKKWKDIKTVVRIKSTRRIKSITATETRCYVSSELKNAVYL